MNEVFQWLFPISDYFWIYMQCNTNFLTVLSIKRYKYNTIQTSLVQWQKDLFVDSVIITQGSADQSFERIQPVRLRKEAFGAIGLFSTIHPWET